MEDYQQTDQNWQSSDFLDILDRRLLWHQKLLRNLSCFFVRERDIAKFIESERGLLNQLTSRFVFYSQCSIDIVCICIIFIEDTKI